MQNIKKLEKRTCSKCSEIFATTCVYFSQQKACDFVTNFKYVRNTKNDKKKLSKEVALHNAGLLGSVHTKMGLKNVFATYWAEFR